MLIRSARRPITAALAALLLASVTHVSALRAEEAKPAADDPVVALVDGAEIHRSDVVAAYETLPPPYRSLPFAQLYDTLLDNVISSRLMVEAARKQGLEEDAEVKTRIQRAADRVLTESYLTKLIDDAVTEDALKALVEAGRVREEVASDLKLSYRFLRKVEHRLQMIEDKLKLAGGSSWNIGAEAEARNKRLHAYVLGAQSGDLISAGPQCLGPEPEKVTDFYQWLKAPYLEGERWKLTAVNHAKTAKTHAKTFEMCAGGSSFFEKGTAAIIQKLENRPKTGMRDWGDQQMVDYWGVAWWRWMHLRAAFDKRAKGTVMPSLLDVVRNDMDFLDFVETIFTQGDQATRSKGEPFDQLWLASKEPGPTVKRRMAEVAQGTDGGGAAGKVGATTPDSDSSAGEHQSKKSNRPNQSRRKKAAAKVKLAAADAAKGAAAHAAIDAAAASCSRAAHAHDIDAAPCTTSRRRRAMSLLTTCD